MIKTNGKDSEPVDEVWRPKKKQQDNDFLAYFNPLLRITAVEFDSLLAL